MVDRARLAMTRCLPLSAIGAGISFVAGFILNLAPAQVMVAAGLTATLVFSGLLFQSFGREKELAETERK
ncbi:hypothetical protein [Nitrososphaera sp.]|uniref:hypothetical protein n=1 Tax=Nitrososphaera sp. TaxID=1971748 RepID=UPI0018201794|nr:hypothetical protein [Nitrososphaera sp.]NWG37712.1 hypothetical protein [Nitrososphaera sp.]